MHRTAGKGLLSGVLSSWKALRLYEYEYWPHSLNLIVDQQKGSKGPVGCLSQVYCHTGR